MDSDTVELQRKLLSTTDARVWAEEFCKLFSIAKRNGIDMEYIEDKVGLMIGWFANAIEVGKQNGLEVHEP